MRWLLVLLLLPLAGAQDGYTLSATVDASREPIAPDGQYPVTLQWTIGCAGAAPEAGADGGQVEWSAQMPNGTTLSFAEPVTAVTLPDCVVTPEVTGTTSATLAATTTAAGLRPLSALIAGSVSWETPTASNSVVRIMELAFVVDYHGLIEAHATKNLKQGEPGDREVYEIAVTNLGNAPTLVRVEVIGDHVTAPEVWPDAPLAPGDQQIMEVRFEHPEKSGWNNDEASFQVVLTPFASSDANKTGDSVTVNSLARTRGMPAPALPLLLIGLAAVARRI